MPRILLFILFVFISAASSAQQPFPAPGSNLSPLFSTNTNYVCSNDILLYNMRKDPAYKAKEDAINRAIQNASRNMNVNANVTLPVVVHIINQSPNNITDPQVISGINDLNDAFGKAGKYAGSAGVDTKIRFCLAQKDPDGGITTGITRTTSYFSDDFNMDIEDARLKNLIQWDPSRYINIWLITNIRNESYANFSCGTWSRLGVTGYATMPGGVTSLDGIVVTAFGSILAHEMGHYLGLYHTFEAGCSNTDCLTSGDRVCDTPPDGSVNPSPSCSNPQNTCFTDTLSNYSNGNFFTDVPDQVTNFMDYGNAACSNQFTQGQADRMMHKLFYK